MIAGELVMDGKWHRAQVAGDGIGEMKGMYLGRLGDQPSGVIANLRDGGTVAWAAPGLVEAVDLPPAGKEDGVGAEIAMEAGVEAEQESGVREAVARPEDVAAGLPWRSGGRSASGPWLGEWPRTFLRLMAMATGHKSRLDRPPLPFGTRKETRERLRAEAAGFLIGREIGAGYRAARAGLDRGDFDERFEAARAAEKEVRLLRGDPDPARAEGAGEKVQRVHDKVGVGARAHRRTV